MKKNFTKQMLASVLHLVIAIGILASCETEDKPVNPQNDGAGNTPGTATEIGEPAGQPIIRMIGKAGGKIATADGKTVFTFPAGALSKDTEITLLPVKSKVPGAFDSLAYVIKPAGLRSALPVTITRTYSPEEVSGTAAELVGIAFQDKQRIWQGSPAVEVDAARRTLKANVPSFEHPMAWYEQFYLTPTSSLLTTNEECLIEIWYTQNRKETEPDGFDPVVEALLGSTLERDEVRNWRVNGVLQG